MSERLYRGEAKAGPESEAPLAPSKIGGFTVFTIEKGI